MYFFSFSLRGVFGVLILYVLCWGRSFSVLCKL